MFASATKRIFATFGDFSIRCRLQRQDYCRRKSRDGRSTGQIGPQVSTMDVGGKDGLMPVRGCNPARVHQDTSLALEVMSNALAIDDGHPLALELESLRVTVAKYQVSIIISFPFQPIS